MMDYRENAGYIITDSCHVGDSEFVLGVHLTAPQQFVTWKCSNRTDYDWGHYFSDLFLRRKIWWRGRRRRCSAWRNSGKIPLCRRPLPIPRGAISRNVKRSAPAFIPFPPQGMAELWCAGNWRKRYSEKKRWAAALLRAATSALRKIRRRKWFCGSF